jgi:hypothetical protein
MMSGAPHVRVESERVVVHRTRLARRATWTALGFFLALTFAGPLISPPVVCFSLAALAVSVWVLAALHFRDPVPGMRSMSPGVVTLDANDLVVDQDGTTRRFALSSVVEGWSEAFGITTVVLKLAGGDLVAFWVRDPALARQALEAAGVSASQHVLRMRLSSAASLRWGGRVFALTAVAALSMCGLFNSLSLFLQSLEGAMLGDLQGAGMVLVSGPVVLLVIAAIYKAVQYLLPPVVTVGTDGVSVRGLGHQAFVPLASIRVVERNDAGVSLCLKDGGSVELPTVTQGDHVRDAIYDRIVEVMERGSSPLSQAKLDLLDRNGKRFDVWRDELYDLGRAAGYRHVVLERDELVTVLGDAKSSPERRVAAALALSRAPDGEARRHVRIAAETCANEHLRIAIERAAEGELEEVELERAMELRSY